jgi:hypothetical protein
MSPRIKVNFLGKIHPTQTAFETFIKNIIYNEIGICDDIRYTHPTNYNILVALFRRHPDFASKSRDMCNIKTIRNINAKAIGTNIVTNNGEEIDISWQTAIKGKHKSAKSELVSAMRNSINPQIIEFKNNNKKECVLCFGKNNIHADHHEPQFEELVKNFINLMKNQNITIPNNFGDDHSTNIRCFLEDDYMFKNKWIKFHKEKAVLRILCSRCNLTRSKTKNKYIHS